MNKQQELNEVFDIDTTKEVQEYPPALSISKIEGANATVTFQEETPRRIEINEEEEDKQKRESENVSRKQNGLEPLPKPSAPAILVINEEDKAEYTLWLSAKSLQRPVLGILQKHDNKLKGIKVKISRRVFSTKKFKDILGYAVQEIKE